ncbi:hypothetical protein ACT3TC_07085 [Halomonas sp. AOP27-A1-41]
MLHHGLEAVSDVFFNALSTVGFISNQGATVLLSLMLILTDSP